MLQSQVHILVGVMGVDGCHRTPFLDQEVQQFIQQVCIFLTGGTERHDAIHGKALEAVIASDQHPAPVSTHRGVVVVPALDSLHDVPLDPAA